MRDCERIKYKMDRLALQFLVGPPQPPQKIQNIEHSNRDFGNMKATHVNTLSVSMQFCTYCQKGHRILQEGIQFSHNALAKYIVLS